MEQDGQSTLLIEAVHDLAEPPIGIAARLQLQVAQNSKVIFVDPNEVRLNPANTRDLQAEPTAIQALADSIHQQGQQVACIGRRLEGGSIELIAGARRWQA